MALINPYNKRVSKPVVVVIVLNYTTPPQPPIDIKKPPLCF